MSVPQIASTAAMTTVTATSPQKILTREGIGLCSSPLESGPQATPPLASRSRIGGIFTPRHPSPLAKAFVSRDLSVVMTRSPRHPTPILSSSLTSHTSQNETSDKAPSVSLSGPSSTMVPIPTEKKKQDQEEEMEFGTSGGPRGTPHVKVAPRPGTAGTSYRFSPGKVISATPPPLPPVAELKKTPVSRVNAPEFVFSPPFTRSAARKAAAVVTGGETWEKSEPGEGVRGVRGDMGENKPQRGRKSTSRFR